MYGGFDYGIQPLSIASAISIFVVGFRELVKVWCIEVHWFLAQNDVKCLLTYSMEPSASVELRWSTKIRIGRTVVLLHICLLRIAFMRRIAPSL